MQLWRLWWNAIRLLRPGCTRSRTFAWFCVIVAGLTIRTELLGVTSLVRALGLHQRFYRKARPPTTFCQQFNPSVTIFIHDYSKRPVFLTGTSKTEVF